MGASTDPGRETPWRMAVWALRVGFGALSVVLAGLIVVWSGGTPWVLAVGMCLWLACAVVTAMGFVRSRQRRPEPRPGFWTMRLMLLHDTVRRLPSARRP